jgi:aminoglycoside phosphotransferase (APT) family kinase protein
MKIPSLNEFESTFNDPVWIEVADAICRRHRIRYKTLERVDQGENIVVFIDRRRVLKIYTPQKNGFRRERSALEFALDRTTLQVPRIKKQGQIEGFDYLITDRMKGTMIKRDRWLTLSRPAQVAILTQLAYGLKDLHSHDPGEFHFDWQEFLRIQLYSVLERQRKEGGNPEWLESIPRYLDEHMHLLPKSPREVFMHGDVHFGNLLVTDHAKRPVISGVFDFADSLRGFHEYEFVAIGVLMIQGQGDLQREFFRAYGYTDAEINVELRRRLMLLTILYEHSSLKRYAIRLGVDPERLTLAELEEAIWNFV